jgi:hypothetical protein
MTAAASACMTASAAVLGYRPAREQERRKARARQYRDLVKGIRTFHNVTKGFRIYRRL